MPKLIQSTALASFALAASLGATSMASAQVVTVELGTEVENKREEIRSEDIEFLVERLQARVEASLERVGAPETLVVTVTLEDVWKDRPTPRQLERQPSLLSRGFERGGASITASFSDPEAGFSGEHSYEWRQTDLGTPRNSPTWSSASSRFGANLNSAVRTIDRFSRALGNSVEAEQAGS